MDEAPQRTACRASCVGQLGQPGLPAVAVDEQPRRDVGQHRELERLRHEPLQQVEGVAVHRADVHLGQARAASTPSLLEDRQDALLELGRRLLGERERDDVARLDARLRQDRRDPLGDDLRLARARARDDLQRLVEAGDRLGLGRGVGRHAVLSPRALPSDLEDLHDFVAVVVDDLDRDLAGLGLRERARDGLVERLPGVLVDVCLERSLEPLVRVVAAREVAVPDEERLLVVVGVDHPQRDLVGVVAAHLAGRRVVDVDALEVDDDSRPRSRPMSMSGSPKTVKRLPAPVFFSSSPMSRSAFIRTISTGMRPSLRTPATWRSPRRRPRC